MKFTEFEKETRITNFAKRCLLDVNYISMMAVFYKILFNGHYMDVSC